VPKIITTNIHGLHQGAADDVLRAAEIQNPFVTPRKGR
jgi:hypothetical protein